MSRKPNTDNPFSASRLRPGAVEFLFGAGESLEDCFSRLEQNAWRGQIRGPHGSGKTTLLVALLAPLSAAGRSVEHFTLHNLQRRLPVSRARLLSLPPNTQLVIDGYEQLPFWRRWRLERVCRRRGLGLLVTTHRDLGLPEIFATHPTPELARRVAARLLEGWPGVILPEEVDRCFAEHEGDLRETFFALYDLFESRRRT
jgi:hypothetical protein